MLIAADTQAMALTPTAADFCPEPVHLLVPAARDGGGKSGASEEDDGGPKVNEFMILQLTVVSAAAMMFVPCAGGRGGDRLWRRVW